jgi:hypothetical protein
MDFFGAPLVIEPWPGQLCCNAGLTLRREPGRFAIWIIAALTV